MCKPASADHWTPTGLQSLIPNSETQKAPKTQHFSVTYLAEKHDLN